MVILFGFKHFILGQFTAYELGLSDENIYNGEIYEYRQ